MFSRRSLLLFGLGLVVAGALTVAVLLLREPQAGTSTTTSLGVTSSTVEAAVPGTSELLRGDLDGARSKLVAHIATSPADIAARYLLAAVEERAGDLGAALTAYRDILSQDSRDFEVHYRIGNIHRRLGDLKQATTEFEESLELNGDFTAARVALAQTLADLGAPDKAIELYFDVIEAQPMGVHFDQIRYALARLLTELGQPDNAALQLEKALVENPDYPEARALLKELRSRPPTTTAPGSTTTTTAVGATGSTTTSTDNGAGGSTTTTMAE